MFLHYSIPCNSKLLHEIINVTDAVVRPISPTVTIGSGTSGSLHSCGCRTRFLRTPLIRFVPTSRTDCAEAIVFTIHRKVEVFNRQVLENHGPVFLQTTFVSSTHFHRSDLWVPSPNHNKMTSSGLMLLLQIYI